MKKMTIARTQFPEFTGDVHVYFDEQQFDLVPERFPPGLTKLTYRDHRVRWVSYFTLKKKPKATKRKGKVKYFVELVRSTGELVYFDGAEIHSLAYTDLEGGGIRAELEADDPGIGWVP